MPPASRPSQSQGNEPDDVYFEPIGSKNQASGQEIKQDHNSDDGDTHDAELAQRKSWIGAYRGQGGLPTEKGFAIQIGSELFRLSGASIMSDAPSYFSKFFEEQVKNPENVDGSVKTLYIDRDPETFKDIARHLQGYHVHPKDGQHYVRLFADAQFYSLPRLTKQLYSSDIYIQIGDQDFRVPKDIFSSPGDSPNFFSLGFGMFFNHSEEAYPGLDREGLIRPPPVEAPRVQSRSGKTFADLLQMLRGYPLHIRGEEHRLELLRDCRYYHLKGLEQKIICHQKSFNLNSKRPEITLRIADLRQTGISLGTESWYKEHLRATCTRVTYARPYTDEKPSDMILELSDGNIMFDATYLNMRFYDQAQTRLNNLLQVIYNKATQEGLKVKKPDMLLISVDLDKETAITLDGEEYVAEQRAKEDLSDGYLFKKRRLTMPEKPERDRPWIITRSQWAVDIEMPRSNTDLEGRIVLYPVMLEAFSGQRALRHARGFLS